MTCPECGGKIRTVDTVHTENNETYRRKKCLECSKLIFTIEYDVEPDEKYRRDWQTSRPSPWNRDQEKAKEYRRNFKNRKKAQKSAVAEV